MNLSKLTKQVPSDTPVLILALNQAGQLCARAMVPVHCTIENSSVSAEDWLKSSLPDYEDNITGPRGQDPRQVVNMKPAEVVSNIAAEEAVKKAAARANEYAQLTFKSNFEYF